MVILKYETRKNVRYYNLYVLNITLEMFLATSQLKYVFLDRTQCQLRRRNHENKITSNNSK